MSTQSTNYGEMRSLLSEIQEGETGRFRFWRMMEKLSEDLREVAMRSYLKIITDREGEDYRTVEYTVELKVYGGNRVYKHGDISTVAEIARKTPHKIESITVNPTLVAGMEISFYINSDSYPMVITEVVSERKIMVADLKAAKRQVELGFKLKDVASRAFTRRQKRATGKRGWAVVGQGIAATRYSGLNFSGAVRSMDPSF